MSVVDADAVQLQTWRLEFIGEFLQTQSHLCYRVALDDNKVADNRPKTSRHRQRDFRKME